MWIILIILLIVLLIVIYNVSSSDNLTLKNEASLTLVSWNPSPNATSYIVFYGLKSGDYTHKVEAKEPNISLSLDKCKTWYLMVRAKSGECLSEPSQELVIKPNLGSPLIVNKGSLSGDNIIFTWSGAAPRYHVNYGFTSGNLTAGLTVNENKISFPNTCNNMFITVSPIYGDGCIGPRSLEASYIKEIIQKPENIKIS